MRLCLSLSLCLCLSLSLCLGSDCSLCTLDLTNKLVEVHKVLEVRYACNELLNPIDVDSSDILLGCIGRGLASPVS